VKVREKCATQKTIFTQCSPIILGFICARASANDNKSIKVRNESLNRFYFTLKVHLVGKLRNGHFAPTTAKRNSDFFPQIHQTSALLDPAQACDQQV
jgi:hypothetical protein